MDTNRLVKQINLGEDDMKIIGQKQKISMSDYTEYVQYLRDQGYNREQLNIDENSEIVSTISLAKGSIGTVVDVRCPCGYKMIIAGRSQLSEGAHAALRLTDKDNIEISPDKESKF